MNKKIFRLPKYIREFGFWSGLWLFFKLEHNRTDRPKKMVEIHLPEWGAIYIRDTLADRSTFWQCLVQRQYNFMRFPQMNRLRDRYNKCIKNGDTPLIIDCGANIGLATLWFGRMFPRAKIISIEPDQQNLKILRLNTLPIQDRLELVEGGVWCENGGLRIINPESGSAAFRVEFKADRTQATIDAYTVSDLCRIGGSSNPLVVKLDIEGSQKYVFQKETEWVSRTGAIVLELDDWLLPGEGTSTPFFSCLSKYDFDYLLGEESIFCFNNDNI